MPRHRVTRRIALLAMLAVFALVIALVPTAAGAGNGAQAGDDEVEIWLTVLHNNDGESQVVDAGTGEEDFGGAARFVTLVDKLKRRAVGNQKWSFDEKEGIWYTDGPKHGVVMISSGDNFLAGPEFNASLENGVPFYDTLAMEQIDYDAVAFGNHDFDFGPDVLADFLAGYTWSPPYVAANLDFRGEPVLQAFKDAGVISKSVVIHEQRERIGVIGLETPNLPFISSPRDVKVRSNLAEAVQKRVDKLEAKGVNKIILAGHLQNILNDVELVEMIDGVDIVIAGGGDELLAHKGDLLIPGDEANIFDKYPIIATDKSGDKVPVVTTSGEYRYVGRLVVGFNKAGEIVAIDELKSRPIRVATDDCNGTKPCYDTVEPDPATQALVVDPVEAALEDLDTTVIADSEVDLDGIRDNVRSMETNAGNLIADSQLWQATEAAPDFGLDAPDVALQNGGGIRNDSLIPAGDITALDTFDMVPFGNFVSIVPDVPRKQFKAILENAVACTQADDFAANPNCGSGRFAQVAGFTFEWDPDGVGQILDENGKVTTAGTRVQTVTLDDATPIVVGGAVVVGPKLDIAITDFLANSGDQYPFRGRAFTRIGFSYQQALANYIQAPLVDGGLAGDILAADYPEGGEGRITELP